MELFILTPYRVHIFSFKQFIGFTSTSFIIKIVITITILIVFFAVIIVDLTLSPSSSSSCSSHRLSSDLALRCLFHCCYCLCSIIIIRKYSVKSCIFSLHVAKTVSSQIDIFQYCPAGQKHKVNKQGHTQGLYLLHRSWCIICTYLTTKG